MLIAFNLHTVTTEIQSKASLFAHYNTNLTHANYVNRNDEIFPLGR